MKKKNFIKKENFFLLYTNNWDFRQKKMESSARMIETTSAKEERDANLHSDYMTIGHWLSC